MGSCLSSGLELRLVLAAPAQSLLHALRSAVPFCVDLTIHPVAGVLYYMPPDKNDASPPADPAEDPASLTELVESGLGSGLLESQEPVSGDSPVAVPKVCPHCGTEYETVARFCPADGTALRPKGADTLIGHVLADRYHILKRIGEGGMGRVYLGEHV